jgi:hypothetical protein
MQTPNSEALPFSVSFGWGGTVICNLVIYLCALLQRLSSADIYSRAVYLFHALYLPLEREMVTVDGHSYL